MIALHGIAPNLARQLNIQLEIRLDNHAGVYIQTLIKISLNNVKSQQDLIIYMLNEHSYR